MTRPWIALSALCLAAACTDRPSAVEVDSESGTSGSTTNDVPPNPTATNPTPPDPDTGVATGDVTGDPTVDPTLTTGPDDTTGEPPPPDGCCNVHESPGCNEPDVVDCVCAQEAFCCAFEWDQNCVDLAMGDCNAVCKEPPPETTGEPGTTTGVMGGDCTEVVTFELFPSDATHSGAWSQGMSMVGEGEISVYNQGGGGGGSVLYEPDIPCNDTWYIWVRYWEQGSDDSYFATIDGMPMPEAIFEGDCTNGSPMYPYQWAALNWRDQMGAPCTYVEDPWAPAWDTGVHQLEFTFRESVALGHILITNDDTLVPPPFP